MRARSNLITAAGKQAICRDAVTHKYQLGLIPKKAKSESNEPLDATARSYPYILTTPTNTGLWLCILLKPAFADLLAFFIKPPD